MIGERKRLAVEESYDRIMRNFDRRYRVKKTVNLCITAVKGQIPACGKEPCVRRREKAGSVHPSFFFPPWQTGIKKV